MNQFNNYVPPQLEAQKGFSIASMILGILSTVLFFTIIPPIIFAVMAIVFGIIGLKKSGKGMAIAGICTAGVGLLLSVAFILIFMVYNHEVKTDSEYKNEAKNSYEESIDKTSESTKAEKKVRTFKSSDDAVSVTYDANLWQLEDNINSTPVNSIAYRDSETGDLICVIQLKEYSEKMTEENYIKSLEKVYKENEVDGSTSINNLKINNKEFSVLHSRQKQGKNDLDFDILIVYNGIKQYEFIFQVPHKNYEKFKDAAYDVFNSVLILKDSEGTVIEDPELAEAMEGMNKLAGIDKKSVLENVSKDGKELIGSWGVKKEDGTIDIRLVLNKDGTYKRYKNYPDESSVLTGTWSYNGNRLLKIHTTKAIENNKDIMSQIKPDQEYEIYFFKDNTMKLMHTISLNESIYIRAD